MKLNTLLCAIVVCLAASLPRSDAATTLYWDGDGAGTVAGGAGTWNVANARWSTTAGGSTYQAWVNVNQDSAVFGGTAGAVAIAATAPTVNVIEADLGGYSFTGTSIITFAGTDAGVFTNFANATTAGSTTLTAPYTGTSLTKTGTGRLELNASTNTMGKYILKAGLVSVPATNRFGTVPAMLVPDYFTFDGGGLASSGANGSTGDFGTTRGVTILAGGAFLGSSAAANTLVIGAPIVGTAGGGLTITGGSPFTGSSCASAGNWTLSNTANSWDGPTTVASSGTLTLGASGVIPDTSTVTLSSSATFDLNNFNETINKLTSSSSTTKLTLGSGTLTINNPSTSFSGVISETGKIVKNGTGNQTFAGTTANTYSGTTTVNGGVLLLNKSTGVNAIANGAITIGNSVDAASVKLSAANEIGDTNNMTINANATFDMNSLVEGIGSIAGAGNVINAGDLSLNRTSGTATFTGSITGGGSLTKNAAGIQVLGGASTYAGTTTINGGTLRANNTTGSATGTNTIAINTGAKLAGSGTVSGAITVATGGHLGGGVGTGDGSSLTVGSTVDVQSGAGLDFVLGAPGTLAGDYNNNLAVDAADYVIWRANNSGNAGAYTTWRGNFGGTGTGTPTADQLKVTAAGGLTLASDSFFTISTGTTAPNGTYTILDYNTNANYTGLLSSIPVNNATGFEIGPVSDNTSNTTFEVNVTSTVQEREWVAAAGGNWSFADADKTNWNPNGQPNGPGAKGRFLSTGGGTVTITDSDKTLGEMTLNNATGYTIAASGTNRLIMNTYGANATLTVVNGMHTISAPMTITKATDITVTNATVDKLTISGDVANTGGITKLGLGDLVMNTGIVSGAGTFKVNAGTVTLSGANTHSGATTVNTGGTLIANNTGTTSGTGTSVVTVNTGGTFNVVGRTTGAITDKGVVNVTGTITGTATVNSTGILAGTGNVASVTLNNTGALGGGHLQPAGSGTIGTITESTTGGIVTFGNDSIFDIDLTGPDTVAMIGDKAGISYDSLKMSSTVATTGGLVISTPTAGVGAVLALHDLNGSPGALIGNYTIIDYASASDANAANWTSITYSGANPGTYTFALSNDAANTRILLSIAAAGSGAGIGTGGAVPEPTALALVGIAGMGLLAARRRR